MEQTLPNFVVRKLVLWILQNAVIRKMPWVHHTLDFFYCLFILSVSLGLSYLHALLSLPLVTMIASHGPGVSGQGNLISLLWGHPIRESTQAGTGQVGGTLGVRSRHVPCLSQQCLWGEKPWLLLCTVNKTEGITFAAHLQRRTCVESAVLENDLTSSASPAEKSSLLRQFTSKGGGGGSVY